MKNRGIPLVIFFILILNEVCDAFAQYCFKRSADAQGVTSIASVGDAFGFIAGAFHGPFLWMGIATVAIVFISWAILLSKVDLSIAMPMTSLSYVFVALTSLIFLHEHISGLRWAGIFLILVGVVIVSVSPHKEEKRT